TMNVNSVATGTVEVHWPGFMLQPLAKVAQPPASCETCAVRDRCLPFGISSGDKAVLAGLLTGRRRLRKGQKLYREGEPFHFLYALRFGTFKSVFSREDGGEHVSAFHLPGDLMGFDGIADGRHPTTAI